MGKTGRWFRSLLSSKKSPAESSYSQTAAPAKEEEEKKSKWAFSKSNDNKLKNGEYPLANPYAEGMDANKHAIAVAAATAVVAEAALAAAKAAAEVVRLTGGGTSGRNVRSYIGGDRRRVTAAAIKIQSAFRAYLARRALRALKGLVKLQALVRGNIVRKQSAEMLRRMQAMARIQARASAHRSYLPELSNSSHPGLANQRNYHRRLNNTKPRGSMQKNYNSRSHTSSSISKEEASSWLDHWMEQKSTFNHRHDDEKNDKILEIDTWKPRRHITSRRAERTFPTSQSFSSHDETTAHVYSKIGSLSRLSGKLKKPINPSISSESSPRVRSAIAIPTNGLREAVTPTRSECSRSLFGDFYLGHPNYMANTESSRAKVRSQSVPKQRIMSGEQRLSTSLCT